jgi:hypothetical protein
MAAQNEFKPSTTLALETLAAPVILVDGLFQFNVTGIRSRRIILYSGKLEFSFQFSALRVVICKVKYTAVSVPQLQSG